MTFCGVCWLSGKVSACWCRRLGFDSLVRKIPWRRKWKPTPVFLPGKSQGQKSLVGYSPWGHTESDMTDRLTLKAWSTLSELMKLGTETFCSKDRTYSAHKAGLPGSQLAPLPTGTDSAAYSADYAAYSTGIFAVYKQFRHFCLLWNDFAISTNGRRK